MKLVFAGLLAAVAFVAHAPHAAAAESYDNCTGYVTSLPAVISTQGTWCLRHDLATSIDSGAAISIATNNVTLDCNDFKIGGLGAGPATNAVGIQSMQRNNITVRRCNVRGFWIGINLAHNATDQPLPPTGQLVEDNRVDHSTRLGMAIGADASIIRNNLVTNTGGNPAGENAVGILTNFGVDVVGNLVDNLYATPGSNAQSVGILAWGNNGGSIDRNRLRGITANGLAIGISTTSDSQVAITDNTILLPSDVSVAIQCINAGSAAARNVTLGPGTGVSGCMDGGGNVKP